MAIQPREMLLTDEEIDNLHDIDDERPSLYTENETLLIYEVKFFHDVVLVRPATPAFHLAVRKLSMMEFGMNFSEFLGDPNEVYAFIEGEEPELYIV